MFKKHAFYFRVNKKPRYQTHENMKFVSKKAVEAQICDSSGS